MRRPPNRGSATARFTGRAVTVMTLVAALLASLLVLTAPATPAKAAEGDPVVTETSFPTQCYGVALGQREPETNSLGFTVTAAGTVTPDGETTLRIAPKQGFFPKEKFSTTLKKMVPVHFLEDIDLMYELPTNSSVISVSIVEGTAQGIEGTPTVTVNTTDYTPGRIVLHAPKVPGNQQPPNGDTFFTFPAIDVKVRATGGVGSTIVTRVAGTNEATSGYVFDAMSIVMAAVRCWPVDEQPAPVMSTTVITTGSSSIPTTTTLTADPTLAPGGTPITLQATVTAPNGAVRFNDGATILGFAEVDSSGVAQLTTPINQLGARSITASYLGGGGFEASVSAPVTVTITDPADRSPVRVAMTVSPARVLIPNFGPTPPATATATITAVDLGGPAPTGQVAFYDNDTLVETQALPPEGQVTFMIAPVSAGHRLRVEYAGDTNYFPTTGSVPLPTTRRAGASFPTLDRPATPTATINTGAVTFPSGTQLNSTYRTDQFGKQTLSGVLVFPTSPQTIAFSGGRTISGRFGQVGTGIGEIQPGSGGAASFSTKLYFQVSQADLGAGPISLLSDCWAGPFDVSLTGSRTGTNGPVNLSASGFQVPFMQPGSCLTADGVSMANQLGGMLAGGNTSLSIAVTPAAAAPATQVSAVSVNPATPTYLGQPVTVSATMSRVDGQNFTGGGVVEIYSGSNLIVAVSAFGVAQPSVSVSANLPSNDDPIGLPGNPSLPEGVNQLWARFVPNDGAKTSLATSAPGPTTSYTVWGPLAKNTPNLELEVVEQAPAGEPVTLSFHLDPAPNVGGYGGTIRVFDDAAAPAVAEIALNPQGTFGGRNFPNTSGATVTALTALAPGAHQLRATFVPDNTSAWAWNATDSEVESHTVVGAPVQTTIDVLQESTRGTGKVRVGETLTAELLVGPTGVTLPWATVVTATPDADTPLDLDTQPFATLDPTGRGTINIPVGTTPGPQRMWLRYDPSYRAAGAPMTTLGNGGFAAVAVPIDFEVIEAVGTMTTKTDMVLVTPSPVEEGAAWDEVRAAVTVPADGTVEFFARNTGSNVTTSLGTTMTQPWSLGETSLFSPAPTAGLTAGTYEVTAVFTPTDPGAFTPSTSSPLVVAVVPDGGTPVASATTLAVVPASPTAPLTPVWLRATAGPVAAGPGSVRFFDGANEVGVATVIDGAAEIPVWNPSIGTHSFTARFEPASPLAAQSTSSAVIHVVAEPAVETTTELAISPLGPTFEGDPVTLTATVSPSAAAGLVEFYDDGGLVGSAAVVNGVASLEKSDLAVGEYEFTAEFVPADPFDYGESISAPKAHVVEERPVGPIETGTVLVVTPASPTTVGEDLTLTATVSPSGAVGSVSFMDGASVIGGPVAVVGGQASMPVVDPAVGAHGFAAVFTPTDAEDFTGSTSPTVAHQVDLPEGDPMMSCAGADQISRDLLEGLLPETDGVITVETPVTATVPSSMSSGTSSPVSFTWSFTIPEALADLAVDLGAEMSLTGMDLAVVSSGAGTGTTPFPASQAITDPLQPVVVATSGEVDAMSPGTVIYTLRSPAAITVAVTEPTQINVLLGCTFTNNIVAITNVTSAGEVPGPPTNLSATAGPLQATVAWDAPEDTGGSALTGYIVTANPGGKTMRTSAEVTSAAFIGLTEGQEFTFSVIALNGAGASSPSSTATATPFGAEDEFSDVPPGHLFFSEITWMAEAGITEGFTDGTFRPTAPVSRQSAAAFLYRLAGSPEVQLPPNPTFSDVPASDQFYTPIEWMVQQDITEGFTDGTFRPTLPVSRQSMAAFLYRSAGSPDGADPTCANAPFNDVPANYPFCGEIEWMVDNRIANGFPDGGFHPTENVSRQSAAAFLYRYTLVVPQVA